MNGTNSIGLPRMCAPPPPNAPVSSLHLFCAFLVLGNFLYSINRVFCIYIYIFFLNFGCATTYIVTFIMLLLSSTADDDDEQSRSVAVALVVVVVVVVVEVEVVVVVLVVVVVVGVVIYVSK